MYNVSLLFCLERLYNKILKKLNKILKYCFLLIRTMIGHCLSAKRADQWVLNYLLRTRLSRFRMILLLSHPLSSRSSASWLSFSVLPGGKNSGQKAQKGPQKKKVGRKNLWPNFGWFYQKVAEKGPQKIFKRSSLFLAVITTYYVHQDEIKFVF